MLRRETPPHLESNSDAGRRAAPDAWSNTLLRDPAGAVVGITGPGEDLTDRKRMEHALQRSEHEYRQLFEDAHDAIIVFSPDDERILNVNERACALYGFTRDEFLRIPLIEITQRPRARRRIRESWRRPPQLRTVQLRRAARDVSRNNAR